MGTVLCCTLRLSQLTGTEEEEEEEGEGEGERGCNYVYVASCHLFITSTVSTDIGTDVLFSLLILSPSYRRPLYNLFPSLFYDLFPLTVALFLCLSLLLLLHSSPCILFMNSLL